MAITALNSTSLLEGLTAEKAAESKKTSNTESFEALLNSAMGMIKETEHYTNLAKEAELSYLSFSAIVRVACQDYLLRRKCSDGLSDKGGED